MPVADRYEEFRQIKKVGNRNVVITTTEEKNQKEEIRFIENFLDKAEEIYERFAVIERNVSEVISMQSRYLEFNEADERLYDVYDEIRKSIYETTRKVTDLATLYKETEKFRSNAEIRICATQILVLKKKLSDCMSNYYHVQEDYKLTCKARVKRQTEIVGASSQDVDFDKAIRNRTEIFLKAILPEFDLSHQILEEVRERHKEFLALEENIKRLHELFFEIAIIVQHDWNLINRIDKFDSIVERVEHGTVNLEKTKLITKKEKKTSTVFYIAVASVIAVIILVIIVAFKI